ncbi:MAG: hypothetical protein JSU74_07090 [Candidatus Zixiibacteriota bacterium]|nr:MAG: hypothetical protein JSU74_07090 [candidate division Zixibacteria bacterium]
MKKTAISLAIVLVLGLVSGTMAGETKVQGRLYAHWMMDLTDGAGNFNDFGVSRAYVTVRSKLSEYTSVRITTDIRDAGGFGGYSIVLKYGYIDWKPAFANEVVTFRFGLQPTPYINAMNKLWGRRYLERTIGDDRVFLTTSDFGAGLKFAFGDKGSLGHIAANVWNGTNYTNVDERNKHKDFSGFVLLTPLRDNDDFVRTAIQAQAYIGTQNRVIGVDEQASDWDRALFSFGGLLAYRNTLDLGGDINFYATGQGPDTEDIKETGYSFFGTLYLEDFVPDESLLRTLNFFGRFDMYDPNTDADDDAETLVIGGVECVPVHGFKASVNIRSVSYQDDSQGQTYLYLNTLFKF